jgi:hypothetical protein
MEGHILKTTLLGDPIFTENAAKMIKGKYTRM